MNPFLAAFGPGASSETPLLRGGGGSRLQSEASYTFNKFLFDLLDCSIPICEYSEIQRKDFLGAGATMSVSKGIWKSQLVAIKTFNLYDERQGDSDFIKQSLLSSKLRSASLEVRVMSSKSIRECPNIVSLLAATWQSDENDTNLLPALVVELANYHHGTLEEAMPDMPATDLETKSQLIWDVVNGLRALHFNAVVHGDLKPENILLFTDEDSGSLIAKLSDFGFCEGDSNLPRAIMAGGTEYWLAPECVVGLSPSEPEYNSDKGRKEEELIKKWAKSASRDMYSFGLVAFFVVTGKKPFGPDRGQHYAHRRMQIWEDKVRGRVHDLLEGELSKHLRLVDPSGHLVSPDFSPKQPAKEVKTLRHTTWSLASPEQIELLFGKNGGIMARMTHINDEILSGKLVWSVWDTKADQWVQVNGGYPSEIMFLLDSFAEDPEDRYEAVDLTETLRPLHANDSNHLDQSQCFPQSFVPTIESRNDFSPDAQKDYQTAVPPNLWPSAFKRILLDAAQPRAEVLEKFMVADCYLGGHGTERNVTLALEWILKGEATAIDREARLKCRSAYLALFFAHQKIDVPSPIDGLIEHDWILEQICHVPPFIPYPPVQTPEKDEGVKEDFSETYSRNLAAKLRSDSLHALSQDDCVAMTRVLYLTMLLRTRTHRLHWDKSVTPSNVEKALLSGNGTLARNTIVECSKDAFAKALDEKMFRQMAMVADGQTWRVLYTSCGGSGGPLWKSFFALTLRRFDNDAEIIFQCDDPTCELHKLYPVLFATMLYDNWTAFYWLLGASSAKDALLSLSLFNLSPLMFAIRIRNPIFVSALLLAGADPNEGPTDPVSGAVLTPLIYACGSEDQGMQFQPPVGENTCFYEDARSYFSDQVKNKAFDDSLRQNWIVQALLTTPGIDVDKEMRVEGSDRAVTALEMAIRSGNETNVRLLLEKGANPGQGSRCLTFPALKESTEYLSILKLLIQSGHADINAQTDLGFTCLYFAANQGFPQATSLLLELGADHSIAENTLGLTPLHVAAFQGNLEIIEILLEAGADRAAKTSGGLTPLEVFTQSPAIETLDPVSTFALRFVLWCSHEPPVVHQ